MRYKYETIQGSCYTLINIFESEKDWSSIRLYSDGSCNSRNFWVDGNGNVYGGRYPIDYDDILDFIIEHPEHEQILNLICS